MFNLRAQSIEVQFGKNGVAEFDLDQIRVLGVNYLMTHIDNLDNVLSYQRTHGVDKIIEIDSIEILDTNEKVLADLSVKGSDFHSVFFIDLALHEIILVKSGTKCMEECHFKNLVRIIDNDSSLIDPELFLSLYLPDCYAIRSSEKVDTGMKFRVINNLTSISYQIQLELPRIITIQKLKNDGSVYEVNDVSRWTDNRFGVGVSLKLKDN